MKKILSIISAIIIFTSAIQIVFAATYVGNSNSRVFHYNNCTSAIKMKTANKVILNSREEAIRNGYRPCKKCKP